MNLINDVLTDEESCSRSSGIALLEGSLAFACVNIFNGTAAPSLS